MDDLSRSPSPSRLLNACSLRRGDLTYFSLCRFRLGGRKREEEEEECRLLLQEERRPRRIVSLRGDFFSCKSGDRPYHHHRFCRGKVDRSCLFSSHGAFSLSKNEEALSYEVTAFSLEREGWNDAILFVIQPTSFARVFEDDLQEGKGVTIVAVFNL